MTKSELRLLIAELLQATAHGAEPVPRPPESDLTVSEQVDSLALVYVVAELEDRLGVQIANGELQPSHLRSVDTLADFLLGKMPRV